jgi:hypothetical protein
MFAPKKLRCACRFHFHFLTRPASSSAVKSTTAPPTTPLDSPPAALLIRLPKLRTYVDPLRCAAHEYCARLSRGTNTTQQQPPLPRIHHGRQTRCRLDGAGAVSAARIPPSSALFLTYEQLYGRGLDPRKAPLRNLRQASNQRREATML